MYIFHNGYLSVDAMSVCLQVFAFKRTAEDGSFVFICFLLLLEEEEPNRTGVQLFMWSKEEAQPAQRVAHNRLGRLVSHLRPLVPPLVLF